MTEFFANGALNPTPTDVQVYIQGKAGAGKTLVAGVIRAALEGLPSTTVCLNRELQGVSDDVLDPERARLKEHPLFVGLAEVQTPHPDEAIIPLSGGRKIPVEMKDSSLKTQIDALGDFIMARCPDQIKGEGACATAEAIINDLLIARERVGAGIDSTGAMVDALNTRIEAFRQYLVQYHPEEDASSGIFDLAQGLLTAQRGELWQIDAMLGNAKAFDDCKSRVEKVGKAMRTAAKAEAAERQRDDLASKLALAEEHIKNREQQIENRTQQRDLAWKNLAKADADLRDVRAERDKLNTELTATRLSRNLLGDDVQRLRAERDDLYHTARATQTTTMFQGGASVISPPVDLPPPYEAVAGNPMNNPAGGNPPPEKQSTITLEVILDSGWSMTIPCDDAAQAVNTAQNTLTSGYRDMQGDRIVVYPPHRIRQLTITGLDLEEA